MSDICTKQFTYILISFPQNELRKLYNNNSKNYYYYYYYYIFILHMRKVSREWLNNLPTIANLKVVEICIQTQVI